MCTIDFAWSTSFNCSCRQKCKREQLVSEQAITITLDSDKALPYHIHQAFAPEQVNGFRCDKCLCPLPPSLSGTARHCHPRASTTWAPARHFPPAQPRPAVLTANRATRPGNYSGAASCCRRGWTAHRPNASYHWLSL